MNNSITKTILEGDNLLHLRNITYCIQPFINSLKKEPKIICNCNIHINNINKDSIKILSAANLLTFIEYNLSYFIIPLSSLKILKIMNIYAYNSIINFINLHNLCIMPDIFYNELYNTNLNTNYNNTVNYINKILNLKRELLDLEFPIKEETSLINNIINSIDLNNFIKDNIFEIKTLNKNKEITLDKFLIKEIIRKLCEKKIKEYEIKEYKFMNRTDSEDYKFINLFSIPYLNTDKILCINIKYFNELKFKCGTHNSILFLELSLLNELINEYKEILIPLKVIFREDNLLFTEVLDINEDKKKILLKRVSSNDRILCDLEYLNFGNIQPFIETESIRNDISSNQEESISYQSKDEESSSSIDYNINPIVRLSDNIDLNNPISICLKCIPSFEDKLLNGKVVEILQQENEYDILLYDLKIEKDIFNYKTEFTCGVPDYYEVIKKQDNNLITNYFKEINKYNNKNSCLEDKLIDNTLLLTITIDPIGCTDIDDAISIRNIPTEEYLTNKLEETIELLNNQIDKSLLNYSKDITLNLINKTINKDIINKQIGTYHEIYIHIADCSEFISINSELDLTASIKGTTFYYNNKRADMLPEILSSNLISLRAGMLRRALTIKLLIYKIKEEFIFIDYEFINDIIINKCKLTYEGAENILNNTYKCDNCLIKNINIKLETDSCIKCNQKIFNIETKYSMNDVKDSLSFLMDFTKVLKQKRGPSAIESITGNIEESNTHSLVEELMLLANQLAAIYIYNYNPECSILRVHKENNFKNNQIQLINKNYTKIFNISINRQIMKKMNQAKYREVSYLLLKANNMNKNIEYIKYEEDKKKELENNKKLNIKKLKQTERYDNKESPFYHFGLNIPIYTHFTSPIRRYADLIVHRFIKDRLFNRRTNLLKSEVIHNLNKQTMKSKILNRISKQISFKEEYLNSEKIFEGIQEEEVERVFNIYTEDKVSLQLIKVFIPEYEIEGFIINTLNNNKILKLKIDYFKGNEVIFKVIK